MLLSSFDYVVTVVGSVSAATAVLDQPWHAVVSDIGLPDGSGLEVARRARSGDRQPGVLIALSGHGREQDIAASRNAGFDVHLVKPVDAQRLLQLLDPSGSVSLGLTG